MHMAEQIAKRWSGSFKRWHRPVNHHQSIGHWHYAKLWPYALRQADGSSFVHKGPHQPHKQPTTHTVTTWDLLKWLFWATQNIGIPWLPSIHTTNPATGSHPAQKANQSKLASTWDKVCSSTEHLLASTSDREHIAQYTSKLTQLVRQCAELVNYQLPQNARIVVPINKDMGIKHENSKSLVTTQHDVWPQ